MTTPPTVPADRQPLHQAWLKPVTPWLYLLVPLALLLTFTYIPVLNMLYYSITAWDGFSPDKPVTGAENYVELFTRPELFQVFVVSLYYLAASFV
ncbi:MAG: raffinose/stachyose/melibiose transport system permease protein, partial [Micromonosporaceae bacterium]|nr:raffinose/stachyose/melibiose transport system permease protein [Micromonosporaceae bacterium]